MQNLKALASAVKSEMDRQKINTYEVADRARKKGYKIVHGTVWNVINCNVKEVKDKSIVAISHGLGLPEQTLFSIVRGMQPVGAEAMVTERFTRIAESYSHLQSDARENIEPIIFALEQTITNFLPANIRNNHNEQIQPNHQVIDKWLDRNTSEQREDEIKKPSVRKAS